MGVFLYQIIEKNTEKVMREYANVIDEIEDTIEKWIYKHGLYDGLKLIIERMKKIDIKK